MTSRSAIIIEPVHPGEVLAEEFLKPMGLSASALARRIGVPGNRISEIAAGRRAVTGDMGRAAGGGVRHQPRVLDEPAEELGAGDGARSGARGGLGGDAGGVRWWVGTHPTLAELMAPSRDRSSSRVFGDCSHNTFYCAADAKLCIVHVLQNFARFAGKQPPFFSSADHHTVDSLLTR